MKKLLLILLGVLLALPGIARDFTYEYEGQTLTYTVIDEDAKTCQTKEGSSRFDYNNGQTYYYAGNKVEGSLKIPTTVSDGSDEFTVVSIGAYAFTKCYGLTSVDIPSSVIAHDIFSIMGQRPHIQTYTSNIRLTRVK